MFASRGQAEIRWQARGLYYNIDSVSQLGVSGPQPPNLLAIMCPHRTEYTLDWSFGS